MPFRYLVITKCVQLTEPVTTHVKARLSVAIKVGVPQHVANVESVKIGCGQIAQNTKQLNTLLVFSISGVFVQNGAPGTRMCVFLVRFVRPPTLVFVPV
jgi:hypothetical protein